MSQSDATAYATATINYGKVYLANTKCTTYSTETTIAGTVTADTPYTFGSDFAACINVAAAG